MCVPHPDTLSMGKHNVWSYIGLQHVPAEQGMAMQSWTRSQTLLQQALFSLLFLSFNDVFCESSRVLDIQIGSDSIGSWLISRLFDFLTSDRCFNSPCCHLLVYKRILTNDYILPRGSSKHCTPDAFAEPSIGLRFARHAESSQPAAEACRAKLPPYLNRLIPAPLIAS